MNGNHKQVEKLSYSEASEKFGKIINKWLEFRDGTTDMSWYQQASSDAFFPKYVMAMISEINDNMPKSMLDEIKRAEISASGHIDYVKKFSYYCAKLYLKHI